MGEWAQKVLWEQLLVFGLFGVVAAAVLLRDLYAVQKENRLSWRTWVIFSLSALVIATTLGWNAMRRERDSAIRDAMTPSEEFQPLSDSLKERFVQRLLQVAQMSKLTKASLHCAGYLDSRQLLCRELEDLFSRAGLQVVVDQPLQYVTSPIDYPLIVSIAQGGNADQRYIGLVPVFAMMLRTAFPQMRQEGVADEQIGVHVLGTPLFFKDGTIAFRSYNDPR
jgi:hypothetical protein